LGLPKNRDVGYEEKTIKNCTFVHAILNIFWLQNFRLSNIFYPTRISNWFKI